MEPRPTPSRTSFRPSLCAVAAALLLALYALLAVTSATQQSLTFDEPLHLIAGYCHWRLNDFRMQPDNGMLPQSLAALPLLVTRPELPPLDVPEWRDGNAASFSRRFLYLGHNDAHAIALAGRCVVITLGMALGLLIHVWTRSLWGQAAALVALGLFALSPNFLAHGQLTTSDLCVTLFFTLTLWLSWRMLNRPGPARVALAGLSTGALFLSKFSAPLILPMLAILFLVRLLGRRPLACSISGALVGKQTLVSLRDQALALVAMILMQGLITWGVIWCAYGLRYAALNPACSSPGDTLPIPWETVLSSPSLPIRAIAFARDHHLMPEAYLFGFAHSFHFSLQRVSFLNGEYSLTGFPEFFPYCLLAKAPPELFVLLLLGGATLLWRRFAPSQTDATSPSPALPDVATPLRSILYELTPLLTITAVYWAVALRTKLNIGDRHLLPIYPPMLMLAGASAVHFARTFPRAKAVVALALAGFALESLLIYPHHLSYFSPLVGGPRQGYRHLVDSSLDWGQDLPALQKWIDRESAAGGPAKPVYLSYFGLASAPYHKVKATLLTSNLLQVIPRGPVDYQPGIYCFSASMLQGVYSDASVNLFGRWNTKYESDYQRLLPYMNRFAAARDDAAAQQALVKEVGGEEAWIMGCRRFEALKLARLAAALRRREPDDYAGYSILIYRLSAPELDAALHGQPAELVAEPR